MASSNEPGRRFHLDESMPNDVAVGLATRGHDCTTSVAVGLIGASDEKQLAFAAAENRVLVTRDRDFLSLAAEDDDHAGIVYWTEKKHFGQLVKDLDALCLESSLDDLRGSVIYL